MQDNSTTHSTAHAGTYDTPTDVLRQLSIIRIEGYVNMLDRRGVQDIAEQIGFDDLEAFCEQADTDEYVAALNEMVEFEGR